MLTTNLSKFGVSPTAVSYHLSTMDIVAVSVHVNLKQGKCRYGPVAIGSWVRAAHMSNDAIRSTLATLPLFFSNLDRTHCLYSCSLCILVVNSYSSCHPNRAFHIAHSHASPHFAHLPISVKLSCFVDKLPGITTHLPRDEHSARDLEPSGKHFQMAKISESVMISLKSSQETFEIYLSRPQSVVFSFLLSTFV